jgi:hypothetical protein
VWKLWIVLHLFVVTTWGLRRACGTDGREHKCLKDFGGKVRRKGINIGGKITLK